MVWRCVSSTATVGSLFTGGRLAVELFELIDMLSEQKAGNSRGVLFCADATKHPEFNFGGTADSLL